MIEYDLTKISEHFEKLKKENRGITEKSILLIGPMGVGKSTTARLLSERTKLPVLNLDKVRWEFFRSIGYSEEERKRIEEKEGFKGVNRYWRPFELQLLHHLILEKLKAPAIIDFGAGQTIYEDENMLKQAQALFANFKNVFLILPFEDKRRCKRELKRRLEHRRFKMQISSGKRVSLLSRLTQKSRVRKDELEVNESFVDSFSNESLASHIVYTNNVTSQTVADAIKQYYECGMSSDKNVKIIANRNRVVPSQTMFEKYSKRNEMNGYEREIATKENNGIEARKKHVDPSESQDEI